MRSSIVRQGIPIQGLGFCRLVCLQAVDWIVGEAELPVQEFLSLLLTTWTLHPFVLGIDGEGLSFG